MSFEKEMEAAMEGVERRARSAGSAGSVLGGKAVAGSVRAGRDVTQLARQTLPQDVHDTCMQTSSLVARVMDMADRLCGPVPASSAGTGNGEIKGAARGEFGEMRERLSVTREGLAGASDALDRIERELL